MSRTSAFLPYFCSIVSMKWSASWAPLLTVPGLLRPYSSAMPSMKMTVKLGPVAGNVLSLWTQVPSGVFSSMAMRALLAVHCSIDPSGANTDRGTTANSYMPTVSLRSISVRLRHTIIILANKERSSCSSINFSLVDTLTFFALLFHVASFLFFILDQTLMILSGFSLWQMYTLRAAVIFL